MPFSSFRFVLVVALCLLLLKRSSAQSSGLFFFQIAGRIDAGIRFYGHPFAASFSQNCLKANFGLVLFTGERKKGVFMQSCVAPRPITELDFKLYPNPAHDYVILTSNTELAGNRQMAISFYNSAGQLVLFESVDAASFSAGIRFNISSLSQGHYLLSIRSQKDQFTLPFIKLP